MSSIKPGFASSLHKESIRAGRNSVRQSLGGQARMRSKRNRCTLAARWVGAERPDRHGIQEARSSSSAQDQAAGICPTQCTAILCAQKQCPTPASRSPENLAHARQRLL